MQSRVYTISMDHVELELKCPTLFVISLDDDTMCLLCKKYSMCFPLECSEVDELKDNFRILQHGLNFLIFLSQSDLWK